MTRDEAIDLLVTRDLARLTTARRATLLQDWWIIDADDRNYDSLPDRLKVIIARSDGPDHPKMPVYDPLLRIALAHSYTGVLNSYLKTQISILGLDFDVDGDVEALAVCACCGYRSLIMGCSYEICQVCFWEDDGTTGSDDYSGPNHMRLGEARLNFRRIGAVTDELLRHVLPDGKDRYKFQKLIG